MKYALLFIGLLISPLRVVAQLPYVPAKNSVQLGADYLGLDTGNGLKHLFAIGYRRFLRQDRVSLGFSAGLLRSVRTVVLVPDQIKVGYNTRRRIVFDLTATYNLLYSVHHALRVGGGPSLWYFQDDLFDKVTPYPIPGGTAPGVQRKLNNRWLPGAHAQLEYSYALSLNTHISLNSGLVATNKTLAPLLGLRAGYRF